jgi:hypothetical protein
VIPGAWAYCPWQHLGDLDGVELRYHREGEAGFVVFDTRVISLRAGMSGAQRRSTLAHEIVHLERGPVHQGATAKVEEYLAECGAILRLIPASVLSELPRLVQVHGLDAAAEFLGLDQTAIRTALDVLNAV